MRFQKGPGKNRGWSRSNYQRTASALTKRGGSIHRKSDAQLDREMNELIAKRQAAGTLSAK